MCSVFSGQKAHSSIAVMIQKDRTEVLDLLDDMVKQSWFGTGIGTGGYRAHAGGTDCHPSHSM